MERIVGDVVAVAVNRVVLPRVRKNVEVLQGLLQFALLTHQRLVHLVASFHVLLHLHLVVLILLLSLSQEVLLLDVELLQGASASSTAIELSDLDERLFVRNHLFNSLEVVGESSHVLGAFLEP